MCTSQKPRVVRVLTSDNWQMLHVGATWRGKLLNILAHSCLQATNSYFILLENIDIFKNVLMFIYSCVCVCVCVCERERERERETDRQTDRMGEGQRERETQSPKQAPGSELSAQSLTWGSNPQTARS